MQLTGDSTGNDVYPCLYPESHDIKQAPYRCTEDERGNGSVVINSRVVWVQLEITIPATYPFFTIQFKTSEWHTQCSKYISKVPILLHAFRISSFPPIQLSVDPLVIKPCEQRCNDHDSFKTTGNNECGPVYLAIVRHSRRWTIDFGIRTGASCDLNAYEDIIPAMFCRPVRRPKVVARAPLDVILLDAHAGTKTAGVNACNLYKKGLQVR